MGMYPSMCNYPATWFIVWAIDWKGFKKNALYYKARHSNFISLKWSYIFLVQWITDSGPRTFQDNNLFYIINACIRHEVKGVEYMGQFQTQSVYFAVRKNGF